MSSVTLPRTTRFVNGCRRKMDKYRDPDPIVIPSLWAELCCLADIAPEGEQGGIHRLRTQLLSGIPQWDLPRYLNTLSEGRFV